MRIRTEWLICFGILAVFLNSAVAVAAPKSRRTEGWLSESLIEASSASPSSFTPFIPDIKNIDNDQNLFTMSSPSTFQFQNEKGQFLKMPVWLPKKTATMFKRSTGSVFSFQFRNFLSSCLLLYLDDGGPRDYIELAIRGNILELRFKFGKARSVKISIGNNLNDRRWHSVSLEIKGTTAILTLDGRKVVGSAAGSDASSITPRSFCYLGGIPKVYRLQELSLPSVYFESGFRGSIRRYAIDGKYQRPIEKFEVTEEVGSDLCYSEQNPCRNNGSCYVRDNQPTCDCSSTNYSGKYCEAQTKVNKNYDVMMSDQASGKSGALSLISYEEAAATFLGGQWFEYDVSKDTISSFSDTITLYFKTKQSNGLMLHTGKSADFVNLSIKNGGISLVVNLGSGAFEVLLKPTVGSFNDNEWHYLKVERELSQGKDNGGDEGASVTSTNTSSVMKSSPPSTSLFAITPSICLSVNLTVDDAHNHAGFRQNDFTELTLDNVFYVGGSPSMISLPGSSETNNFIGCLKEVTYQNPEKTLKLSRMAKNNDPKIRKRGEVEYRCSDIEEYGPVSFRTPESFLKLNPWKNPTSEGMKLNFITTEPHGLLLYAYGVATLDYIAIELYDGILYLLINLGSGPRKIRLGNPQRLNDGLWHQIRLRREMRTLTINVDNKRDEIKLTGTNTELNVKNLYLGGADFREMATKSNLPKGLWTAALKYGFVGCMRDVYIDGNVVDIYTLAKSKDIDSSAIAPECPNPTRNECSSNPCRNGGKCMEGWKRFICDCSETSYSGKTCELVVQTVGFNGSQSLQFPMSSTQRTQTETISFRFKTPLSSGLLLTTTSKTTADRLTVKLVKEGQVKLTVDLDCFKKNCTAPRQGPASYFGGSSLNDNKWHTVKIERKGRLLSLEVDGDLDGSNSKLPVGHTELQFDVIQLGKATGPMLEKIKADLKPSFAGLIQNLMFNNDALIDNCFNQISQPPCQFTGSWGASKIISNAITFQNKDSYISTATLNAYTSMTLFFNLRTTITDGLILYNAGRNMDFIAVELVGGFVHYVYNLGNGPQVMSTPDQKQINDNEWHEIRIVRDVANTHTLSVDGIKVTMQGNNDRRNLDLQEALYIGGVRRDMYYTGLPDRVASRQGFQGCLGTFDFNGVSPQLLGKDRIQSSGDITKGCTGPTEACNRNSCLNGGVCKQEWNSFTCDCSLTSYIGRRCEKHISTTSGGTSFRFNGGMIMYKWPSLSQPSSRSDNLAFGFTTRERNCVLTRISSPTESSIKDFMQLEIENGRLTLRFNIGTKTIVLDEPKGVADGQYHRVVVCRKWMNATLRVDNWPQRTYGQKGNARNRFALAATSIPLHARPTVTEWMRRQERKNTVFNSQSKIQIGGIMVDDIIRAKRATKVIRPFRGQMTGFIFNDVSVFKLAEQRDRRVTIYEDVKLINDPPPIAPTPPGNFPYPTTMATMTTFKTSSSRPDYKESPSDGSECDDEELCSGASDKSNKPKSRDGFVKDAGASSVTPGVVMPPLSTRTKKATSSTKNILPKMTTTETVESKYNESNMNESANLSNGDNKINIKREPDVKTGFLGGILNGTTAMIAGIVGAAVICIIIILAAIYKYKHKDENSFSAGKKMKNGRSGNGSGHAGSIVRKNNGSLPMKNMSLRGKEVDKEYYV